MNLIPSNWAQTTFQGDMPALPTDGQLWCIVLHSGETLLWFSEALRCCVFRLPPVFRPWMAFGKQVPRSVLGLGGVGHGPLGQA